MITRKSNWPEILLKEIEAARTKPFKFGSHDCCMFVSSTFEAISGVDLAADLRGYRTQAGAVKTLKKKGKGDLLSTMDWVMESHGCDKADNVAMLQRGDICMAQVALPDSIDDSGVVEWAVGICVGSEAVFASDGVVMVSMSEVDRGWFCG